MSTGRGILRASPELMHPMHEVRPQLLANPERINERLIRARQPGAQH